MRNTNLGLWIPPGMFCFLDILITVDTVRGLCNTLHRFNIQLSELVKKFYQINADTPSCQWWPRRWDVQSVTHHVLMFAFFEICLSSSLSLCFCRAFSSKCLRTMFTGPPEHSQCSYLHIVAIFFLNEFQENSPPSNHKDLVTDTGCPFQYKAGGTIYQSVPRPSLSVSLHGSLSFLVLGNIVTFLLSLDYMLS